MRRSCRGAFIGAAVVIALGAWPAAAAASTAVHTSGTNAYPCFNADNTDVVFIQDTYSTTRYDSFVHSVDVLTNPLTGESIRYVSNYRLVSDADGYSLQGSSILDLYEPVPSIYYLKGHASILLSAGGYAAFRSADEIIDVCAALVG
jgi:hypothetical protein